MNNQSKIQERYDKNNTRRFGLKLNITTDREIIEKLEAVDSIQGYIKELIRKDIKED